MRALFPRNANKWPEKGSFLRVLLDERGEPIKTFAHVGMAKSQMHFHAGRHDHYRFVSGSAPFRRTASGSCRSPLRTPAVRPAIRRAIVPLVACRSPCSRTGPDGRSDGPLSKTTDAHSVALSRLKPSSARQRKSTPAATPQARATPLTVAPGCSLSSTIASFSSALNLRRRRCSRPGASSVALVNRKSAGGALVISLRLSPSRGRALGLRCVRQSISTSPTSKRLRHRFKLCNYR